MSDDWFWSLSALGDIVLDFARGNLEIVVIVVVLAVVVLGGELGARTK